jgi:segregation and condensation protein B
LAVIAYQQPVTRPEIEHWRGVAVSTQIMQQLQDRSWIMVAGHRETPGRPALWVTTPQFLEHFSLASLAGLPTVMGAAEV